jgi:hypothetical protein
MGFFSWITQDTNKSITNKYGDFKPITVIMTDDKGTQYSESEYEGYGEFGGKDYYVLVAEMNKELLGNPTEFDREMGIDLAFKDEFKRKIIFPSLSESGAYYDGVEAKCCPNQGCF